MDIYFVEDFWFGYVQTTNSKKETQHFLFGLIVQKKRRFVTIGRNYKMFINFCAQ